MQKTMGASKAKRTADRLAAGGSSGFEALAERLCPDKTEGELRNVLVPACRGRLTPADVRARALERVAAVVSRTCRWGQPVSDWHVGDYRFLVLEFAPARDVCLYVQLWTEPEEPVLVEICSGAWNPTARPHVGPPQRAALRRLGYRVGGRARNYRKFWTLSPLADARALAEELVEIVVGVLGYRGRRELAVVYHASERTEAGRVFPSLAIDDLKRMLAIGGCQVADTSPRGPVSPEVSRRLVQVAQPFPFFVEMRGRVGKTPATYEAMRFVTVLPGGRDLSPGELERLVRECPFGRIFRDDEGDLLMVHDLLVAGTTVRWFMMALGIWQTMRARAIGLLGLLLAPPAPGPPGAGGWPEDDVDPDAATEAQEEEMDERGGAGRPRETVH